MVNPRFLDIMTVAGIVVVPKDGHPSGRLDGLPDGLPDGRPLAVQVQEVHRRPLTNQAQGAQRRI